MPDSPLPSPGTACRALRWRGHAVQALISAASARSASSFIRTELWDALILRWRFASEVDDVGVRPHGHLDDVHLEAGALEHRERLLARREEELLPAAAGEPEADRDHLLRVGEGVARVQAALLRLHDER